MPKKSKKQQRFKESAVLINVKDFLVDTADFTAAEAGYYFKLLCLQWANKSISSNPLRLEIAVGDHTSQSDSNRDSHRDSNSPSNRETKVPVSVPFMDCWEHIKTKFVPHASGGLVNLRMEEEREEFMQYQQTQEDRTKKAREALEEKRRNSVSDSHSHSDSNRDSNMDKKIPVTGLNTNTNTNSINTEYNKKENLQAFAVFEKKMVLKEDRVLTLRLPLDDGFTSREISKLLEGNLERMVMIGNLWERPDDYLVFLFEAYFKSVVANGQETTAGKINKDFMFWFNNCSKTINHQYNDSQKDITWFNEELKKANGICKDDKVRKKFAEYYLMPTKLEAHYFQSLNNFDVIKALTSWVEKDYKTVSKLKSPKGVTVMPGDKHSIEEIENFYKL